MWFKKVKKEINGITLDQWLEKHRDDFKGIDIEIYAGKANVYGSVAYAYGINNLSYGRIADYKHNVVRDAISILNKEGKLAKVMVFMAK
jgi:hypothetical protein